MEGSHTDNKTRGIRKLSAGINCFREKLKNHQSCFIQAIRLSLDGIPLGHGIKFQALLIQFQGSIATRSELEGIVLWYILMCEYKSVHILQI